jgi:hypothetical protein
VLLEKMANQRPGGLFMEHGAPGARAMQIALIHP